MLDLLVTFLLTAAATAVCVSSIIQQDKNMPPKGLRKKVAVKRQQVSVSWFSDMSLKKGV
jgi:hypothetical protein